MLCFSVYEYFYMNLRQEYEIMCCFRPTRAPESGNSLAMFFRSLAPNFNAQVDLIVHNNYVTWSSLLVSCLCVHIKTIDMYNT